MYEGEENGLVITIIWGIAIVALCAAIPLQNSPLMFPTIQ
jgi:hypothetical protein